MSPIIVDGFPFPAYTTVDDLRDALAPVGDQSSNATAASLPDVELEDVILDAQREVDSRLGARYSVPFPEEDVPVLIASITRDIAAYLATLTHRKSQQIPENHPVLLRHDRAQRLLADLQSGKGSLEGSGEAGEPEPFDPTVVNPYEGDLFGLDQLGLGPSPVHSPAYDPGWPY